MFNKRTNFVLLAGILFIASLLSACASLSNPDSSLPLEPETFTAFKTEGGQIALNWVTNGADNAQLILRRYNPATNELMVFDQIPEGATGIIDEDFDCDTLYRYYLSAHNAQGSSEELCITVTLPEACESSRDMIFIPCEFFPLVTLTPPSDCGDGICSELEDHYTCPEDCLPSYVPYCGDDWCNGDETILSCPGDCLVTLAPLSYCGDGECNGDETILSCPGDCLVTMMPLPYCGDGECNGDETILTCPGDCMILISICGDGICTADETMLSCPVDCSGDPILYCGDGICNGGETHETCPDDCVLIVTIIPPLIYCGDGICNGDETLFTCAADCMIYIEPITECGDGICNGDENCFTCTEDCGPCAIITPFPISYCGDGTCNGSETYSSCPDDCGPY